MAGGCDRQSGSGAQPQASESAPAPGAESGADEGAIDRSHKGSELPEFKLSDTAGKSVTLSSLKGKPLLINLWATWCAPCVAELPQLDALAAAGKLQVLAVNQEDKGSTAQVPGFLKERGVKVLKPWIDPEGELTKHYGAEAYPLSVLYDSQGREVWRVAGPRDWTSADTAAALAEAR
jgi:thiol-disulfide isomerase/thioredoxin